MEDQTITVPLPAGFDPRKHGGALVKFIAQNHGEGWEISGINLEKKVAYAVRRAAMVQVSATDGSDEPEAIEVNGLPPNTKPTDGDKWAVTLIRQHPGYHMVKFDPFLGKATLAKLTEDEFRCRGAVAVALGVKPWDVLVRARRDGGFDLTLPKTYVPSKHDTKLTEVAETVVGKFGWYVKTDPAKLTATIIPSDPPTFPEIIPLNLKKLGTSGLDRTPFGMKLPEPGQKVGETAYLDWTMSPYMLLGGLPRAGKFLTHDTPVPVPLSAKYPTGWARHGDLAVGDEVFTPFGSVATVDEVSAEVEDDVYEVVFTDGQIIKAGASHLWTVSSRRSRTANEQPKERLERDDVDARRESEQRRLRDIAKRLCDSKSGMKAADLAKVVGVTRLTMTTFLAESGVPYVTLPGKGRPRAYPAGEAVQAWADHVQAVGDAAADRRMPLFRTLTTEQMVSNLRVEDGRANWAVQVSQALDLPSADLPLSPYVLGVWLGDGVRRAGAISIGNKDRPDMIPMLNAELGSEPHRDESTCLFWPRPDPARCKRGHDDWAKTRPGRARRCRSCPGSSDSLSNLSLGEAISLIGARTKKGKVIPAEYLRSSRQQRLALLQGLMDSDGWVSPGRGSCELTLCDESLAGQALELIRSLGCRASMHRSNAAVTRPNGMRDMVGVRYRIGFSPSDQVFRLPRKAERLEPHISGRSPRARWNYVVDIRPAGRAAVKCIRINDPSHLYLAGGFIPTHNTVSLTNILADAIASGYELVIVDTPDKSVDFTWAKPYVRDGGWGCDGLRSSVTALRLAHAELKRRADILKERGVENWYRLPEKERFKPILVVVDEVSMLLMTDRLPAGVDKKSPEVQEIIQRNLLKFRIQKTIYDIMAEMGFVGARVILSSQVTNAATGLPPTMKALIGNKGLQGSNPSKSQRDQAFNVAAQVPVVPENLRGGGMAAKGVGAAEFEGQEPFIYKPSFAPVNDITVYLNTLNLRRTTRPEPTEAEMDFHCPLGDSEDFEDDVQPLVVGERTPSGKPLDPKFGPGPAAYGADGKKLKGAAAASHGSKALAEGGPVTVTRLPLCPSCDRPIRPDGECGCS